MIGTTKFVIPHSNTDIKKALTQVTIFEQITEAFVGLNYLEKSVMLGNSIRCTCFSPQGQIYNSSLLELKHIKPNPHLTLTLSLIPTLSLTLKPTPSLTLTLTPPLTLKHYPLKNT